MVKWRRSLSKPSLPNELWRNVGSLLNADEYSAISLAGLPGGESLNLKLSKETSPQFLSRGLQVKTLRIFRRRLRLKPVLRKINRSYELGRISELVLWESDWTQADFEATLKHLPLLRKLEIDVLSVTWAFFGTLQFHKIENLRIAELRYTSKEDVAVSNSYLKTLSIGFYSIHNVSLVFKDMEAIQEIQLTAPFVDKIGFHDLTKLESLDVGRVKQGALDDEIILRLSSLKKLVMNFLQLHEVDLSLLEQLEEIKFTGCMVKLPKGVLNIRVEWTGEAEELVKLISQSVDVVVLDITCPEKSLLSMLPPLQKLKALKLNNFAEGESELTVRKIYEKFPNLEALSIWSKSNTAWFPSFDSWCKK